MTRKVLESSGKYKEKLDDYQKSARQVVIEYRERTRRVPEKYWESSWKVM